VGWLARLGKFFVGRRFVEQYHQLRQETKTKAFAFGAYYSICYKYLLLIDLPLDASF
jgi:hypothetical protein